MSPPGVARRAGLSPRQQGSPPDEQSGGGNNNNTVIIVAASLVGTIVIALIIYTTLRILRLKNFSPRYIPSSYLKEKWTNWSPFKTNYRQVSNPTLPVHDRSHDTTYRGAGGAMTDDAGVNRNTSIRSIMTLPAYSPIPKPTELVIGREGERSGMDVVVEFPETVDEEESRREDQMESLYQIRLARRQENAEREERRRQRREAREARDFARLEELRRESRTRSDNQSLNGSTTNLSAAVLMAEHQSRERERRISSVSYAAVGHVRHDGTRLRANSAESDQQPLLDSAAVMGAESTRNSAASMFNPPSMHQRGTSASSMMSVSTTGSDLEPTTTRPETARSASASNVSIARTLTAPEAPHGDIGDTAIPPPPDYDALDWGDAPAYESPVAERGERFQLPTLTTLPSIEIRMASPLGTSPNTPAVSQPPSEYGTGDSHAEEHHAGEQQRGEHQS